MSCFGITLVGASVDASVGVCVDVSVVVAVVVGRFRSFKRFLICKSWLPGDTFGASVKQVSLLQASRISPAANTNMCDEMTTAKHTAPCEAIVNTPLDL